MLVIYLILSSFALALIKAEQKMKGKKFYFPQTNQCLGSTTYDLNFYTISSFFGNPDYRWSHMTPNFKKDNFNAKTIFTKYNTSKLG